MSSFEPSFHHCCHPALFMCVTSAHLNCTATPPQTPGGQDASGNTFWLHTIVLNRTPHSKPLLFKPKYVRSLWIINCVSLPSPFHSSSHLGFCLIVMSSDLAVRRVLPLVTAGGAQWRELQDPCEATRYRTTQAAGQRCLPFSHHHFLFLFL
jgi:hypothetical protein